MNFYGELTANHLFGLVGRGIDSQKVNILIRQYRADVLHQTGALEGAE